MEGLSREYKVLFSGPGSSSGRFFYEPGSALSFSGPSPQSSRAGPRSSSLLDQAQASVQDQPVSQAQFPVLLPQGQGRPPPVLVCHGALDSLYGEENFSLDLDNEAALRVKQARSEALDTVAEFCKLDRQDPEAKREIMLESLIIPSRPPPTERTAEDLFSMYPGTLEILEFISPRGQLPLQPHN